MTKEEYIAMKEKGQFELPFFYQYYVENIEKSMNRVVLGFDDFCRWFPMWWNQTSFIKEQILDRCTRYFNQKFNIAQFINPNL